MMEILGDVDPEIKDAMQNILNTFSGYDGGASFVQLCRCVTELDNKAKNGDQSSKTILQIIIRFNNIIRFAKGEI